MSKKIFLLVILLTLSSFLLFAESDNTIYKNGIGMDVHTNFGSYVNAGISYQHWFNRGLGYQITIGTQIDKNSVDVFSGMIDLQKMFFSNYFQKTNVTTLLFGWASVGYTAEGFIHQEYTDSLAVGAGFGIDIIISERISLPLKIGCMAAFSATTDVGFSLGLGYKYRF